MITENDIWLSLNDKALAKKIYDLFWAKGFEFYAEGESETDYNTYNVFKNGVPKLVTTKTTDIIDFMKKNNII